MPYLIGIAGPSCSGKSELAGRLAGILEAPVFSLDSYYLDLAHLPLAERARTNFDDPAALDSALLVEHLSRLARGEAVEKPIYDFSKHTRAPDVERVIPTRYLIVEGLFTLYWEECRRLLGTKVYIDVTDQVSLERRLARDVRERGRTRESVLEQYERTVRPMAELYIRPTARHADVIVSGVDPLERSAAAVLAHVRVQAGAFR